MSQYGLTPCSWGNSMLKPTETAPPSCAPRLAASIAPGPPPVMTLKLAFANSRAVSRAAEYTGCCSRMRAEPKIETAGLGIFATASKPLVNSSAIRRTRRRSAPSSLSRRRRSSTGCLQVLVDVACAHREDEERGEAEVNRADREALPRLYAVVGRPLGVLALLPASPDLEAAQ